MIGCAVQEQEDPKAVAQTRYLESFRHCFVAVPPGDPAGVGFRRQVARMDLAPPIYGLHQDPAQRPAGSSWIWKSWAPPRAKFFAWLAFRKRLWTADRRRRHGLEACGPCWLCDQEEETVDHLLVNCSFAKVIWWNTLSWMECSCTFLEPMTLQQ